MIKIRIKKGYDLKIKGPPSSGLYTGDAPQKVAVLPERIPFIKPRLKVKKGQKVKIGSVLFEDKKNPGVLFLSPGGGVVDSINYGPKRIIKSIIIALDKAEKHESFPCVKEDDLGIIERGKLVDMLVKGGVWPFIRRFPYMLIPNPGLDIPEAVYVNFSFSEPFWPDPSVYLTLNKRIFSYGIKALKKLAKRVMLCFAPCHTKLVENLAIDRCHDLEFVVCKGPYPANEPGVVLYHTKKSPKENTSWFISGQDLILLASMLKNGKYPITRIIAAGGPFCENPSHVKTRMGAPVKSVLKTGGKKDDIACISGGIFRGYLTGPDDYLGFYETSLIALSFGKNGKNGKKREILGFARPGFNKNSYSRAFLSAFNKKPFEPDCNIHGEERSCINCGTCAKVCPVDIFPSFLMKAIYADEIEEALALGMLDCAECGLCTHVCPSKIELGDIIKNAKFNYYSGF